MKERKGGWRERNEGGKQVKRNDDLMLQDDDFRLLQSNLTSQNVKIPAITKWPRNIRYSRAESWCVTAPYTLLHQQTHCAGVVQLATVMLCSSSGVCSIHSCMARIHSFTTSSNKKLKKERPCLKRGQQRKGTRMQTLPETSGPSPIHHQSR